AHPGCISCYAERQAKRNPKLLGTWGPVGIGKRVRGADAYWAEPLKWNAQARAMRERKRVFCQSLADVFEDWRGPILDTHDRQLVHDNFGYTHDPELPAQRDNPCTMDDLRHDMFHLIDETDWLDWLLLTKRPQNIPGMWPAGESAIGPVDVPFRSNVWLGTS